MYRITRKHSVVTEQGEAYCRPGRTGGDWVCEREACGLGLAKRDQQVSRWARNRIGLTFD